MPNSYFVCHPLTVESNLKRVALDWHLHRLQSSSLLLVCPLDLRQFFSTYSRLAWANEPPSDEDEDNAPMNDSIQGTEHRTSDAHSRLSSHTDLPSRWWVFNESRNRVVQPARQRPTSKFERRSLRDISTWMPGSVVRKDTGSFVLKGKASYNWKDPTELNAESHIVSTPKLDAPREGPSSCLPEIHDYGNLPSRNENYSPRRNGWRSFILTNVYVPLVCA